MKNRLLYNVVEPGSTNAFPDPAISEIIVEIQFKLFQLSISHWMMNYLQIHLNIQDLTYSQVFADFPRFSLISQNSFTFSFKVESFCMDFSIYKKCNLILCKSLHWYGQAAFTTTLLNKFGLEFNDEYLTVVIQTWNGHPSSRYFFL